MQVEVGLDHTVLMLFDAKPGWPAAPAHRRVYVEDIAATVGRAVVAGLAW
ncbi:hypothetical protein ACIBG7_13215 [Nonomuraea sp. NPDC050328]